MLVVIAKRSLNNDPHCGDDCHYWRFGNQVLLCVVDGLGHGKFAEQAAKAAVNYVSRHRKRRLPDIIAGCDEALNKTRGVVMGLILVDENTGDLTHAAIGNTRSIIARKELISLASDPGIVGGGYRKLSPNRDTLNKDDLVIMTTDGLEEMITLQSNRSLAEIEFEYLAEHILLHWGHGRDDAAVLVYRW